MFLLVPPLELIRKLRVGSHLASYAHTNCFTRETPILKWPLLASSSEDHIWVHTQCFPICKCPWHCTNQKRSAALSPWKKKLSRTPSPNSPQGQFGNARAQIMSYRPSNTGTANLKANNLFSRWFVMLEYARSGSLLPARSSVLSWSIARCIWCDPSPWHTCKWVTYTQPSERADHPVSAPELAAQRLVHLEIAKMICVYLSGTVLLRSWLWRGPLLSSRRNLHGLHGLHGGAIFIAFMAEAAMVMVVRTQWTKICTWFTRIPTTRIILTMFWQNPEKVLMKFWQSSDIVLTNSDKVLTKFWQTGSDIFRQKVKHVDFMLALYCLFIFMTLWCSEKVLTKFWQSYDKILTKFWQNSDEILIGDWNGVWWHHSNLLLPHLSRNIVRIVLVERCGAGWNS